MKTWFTFILLSVQTGLLAQSYTDSSACFFNPCLVPHIDTVYTLCQGVQTSKFALSLDTNQNNLWQFGHTSKFGNSSVRDSSCALITDSLNVYPINNTSKFTVFLNPPGWIYNQYIKFWHRFDTDSLLDGCWIECSEDSGTTWFPLNTQIIGMLPLTNNVSCCNVYNNNLTQSNFDTLLNGQYAWSGNSNGWRYTSFILNFIMPIKPGRFNTVNALRFVFHSDSIQNNKSGWMIDDIETGYVISCGGLESMNTQTNRLPVYPNPSSNGIFTLEFPTHAQKGKLELFSSTGQKLNELPLQRKLDLTTFSSGLYFYRTTLDGIPYTGTLLIQP
ncbi:MAG: T9SS type A sorting domain-containing protein [Chitinophagaceae bacterium]|nr:T9SS type A sorting domain-containing protein [Chitinophagaceae bacterium]